VAPRRRGAEPIGAAYVKDLRRLWFYYLASYLVRNYARVFRGLEVEGQELIPKNERGLIIAGNHISSFDPPLIGSLVPREIHFMAKRELFEKQPLRIKEALRLLKSGVAVGIFPQGTRNAGDAAALDGAAFLAQRAEVPLQPVALWQDRGRLRVRFGEPLYPKDKSKGEMSALTQTLMTRISAMLPASAEAQKTLSDTR
jgi:1-acyl-sn-glycerol-3-phosphate acyltransferase